MNCDQYPWSAYRKTHVEVHMPDGSVKLLEQVDGEVGEWPFGENEVWILTAFNPLSVPLSEEENQLRHLELGKQLRELELPHLFTRGFDPDEKSSEQWSEDGYAVIGGYGELVLDLASQWKQNAVFVWRPSEWLIQGVEIDGICKSGWRYV